MTKKKFYYVEMKNEIQRKTIKELDGLSWDEQRKKNER
jgi:hypothetical protein